MTDTHHLTMSSRIGELYATPIGHDILCKVLMQMGKSEKLVTNPAVARIPLKIAARLTSGILDRGFWETFLHLVNSEQEVPGPLDGPLEEAWWKEAVFYQIYPRTFCDSNGDGAGDLQGIISKLDYLKQLGINAIWLSPIYDSPNDDNGYDIRDYRKIQQEFGTMADFDQLLQEVHARGMRLIMDLVVNHTSDEHAWFQQALKDPQSPYRKYYFFRPEDGTMNPPNNWKSFFSGPAWNHYLKEHCWALHLFSKKQMDLNWDEPQVRSAVIDMISWWLEKGVDGFRMDVINYISKDRGLPDGNESLGRLMEFTGIEHYYYGPHLHEYLREIHDRAFAPHHAFSVGETPGLGMKMARLVTGQERGELDMIFSFDHLETPGHTRFEDYAYDLNYFRDYMIDWMMHYGNNCWMSIFYDNHDNPRMVSKVSMDPQYRQPIEKLLAVMQMTLKGTPFIFQGDEMGLTNVPFTSIDEITDVESRNLYQELTEKKTPEEAMKIINAGTREHARLPLPWNPPRSEALRQKADPEIAKVYQQLIALRHDSTALVYGSFEVIDRSHDRFVYVRTRGSERYLTDCNLGSGRQRAHEVPQDAELVFPSTVRDYRRLEPYEARIWKLK